jgi:hypothetical protein
MPSEWTYDREVLSFKQAHWCKSDGCVRKAAELASGGLPFVPESGLRVERSILTWLSAPFENRLFRNLDAVHGASPAETAGGYGKAWALRSLQRHQILLPDGKSSQEYLKS